MKIIHCACGCTYDYEVRKACRCCLSTKSEDPAQWTQNRFRKGDIVNTVLGKGKIVGIDLPWHKNAWRWLIEINSINYFDNKNKLLAFFDHEVSEIPLDSN